jgi:hypothetical protein
VKDDAASISDILAGSFNGAGDAIGNMANQLARFAENPGAHGGDVQREHEEGA